MPDARHEPSDPACPAPHGSALGAAPGGSELDRILRAALAEDLGAAGDITSAAAVAESRSASGRLEARAAGRLAGIGVFLRVFELLDPDARSEALARDGDPLEPGRVLARVHGRARALLAGERTALNLVQRLSGIATFTARHVEVARRASGGRARVLDTRKTTPGLRALEKYAVRCGGGGNHRMGLYDEAMVKDNHRDLAGLDVRAIVERLRASGGPALKVTVEARGEAEALEAARSGADVVLLDNSAPDVIRALIPRLRAAAPAGRALEIEASGGIGLANLAEFAAAGVDRISIGALTHSAPALDLAFKLEPEA
jgi:nicotinate-nucleotide pyrophosphorylase (carboxylating)